MCFGAQPRSMGGGMEQRMGFVQQWAIERFAPIYGNYIGHTGVEKTMGVRGILFSDKPTWKPSIRIMCKAGEQPKGQSRTLE